MNVPPCSPEPTKKFEVSLSKLHCNVDLLLDRDMNDCSAKHLTALIQKDYKIYINKEKTLLTEQSQNEPRCAGHKEEITSTIANAGMLEAKNSKGNVHLPSNDLSVDINYSRRGNSDCEASSFDVSKASFHEEKYVKENRAADGKRYSCKTVEERLLDCSDDGHKEVMLPSNGWWLRNADSDSESNSSCDTDDKDTETSTGHNLEEMKGKSKESYCQTANNDSIQGLRNVDRGELSTTASNRNIHFPGNPDGNSPIFHLTSFDPEVASPSSLKNAEKVCTLASISGERGYNKDNNNTSIKYFDMQSLTGEDAVLPDDLKLDCKTLFAFHTSVNSRTACQVPIGKAQCMMPEKTVKPPLNKAEKGTMETASSLTSRREEMFQEYKEDNNDKKIVFVPFKQASQNSLKDAPNKPAQPVKLKMKHRRDNGTSIVSDAMLSGDETDGRLLPTTLTHSDKNSYSLMSPYMANVVWSVMKDENV